MVTHSTRNFILAMAFLLSAIDTAVSIELGLELMPKEDVQRKPINDTTMVACSPVKGSPPIPNTNIRWLDPTGNPLPKAQGIRKHTEFVKGTLMLLIESTSREDEGNYTCVADIEGRQLSASFELKTFVELTWADTPPLQHPRANSSGYIRCSVISEPPAEVDWLLNGNIMNFEEGGRCQTTKEGIHCQPILKEDNGVYTCRARVLAIGKIKMTEIRVEVHTPPKIHRLNGTLDVIEGDRVTLNCAATGDPMPFYSWEDKNNANLKGRPGYHVDEERGTLIIDMVSKDDAGSMRCIANNSAGEDSWQATLSVVVKPTISMFNNVTVGTGKKSTMSCHVYAEPYAKVEFLKVATDERYFVTDYGSDVSPQGHVHVSVADNGSAFDKIYTLEFLPVERTDDGLYECTASNKGGSVSSIALLQVEYAPEFITTPSTQWSWLENPVNLTCAVNAIPNATITWTFEGTPIDSYPSMKVFESENNSTIFIYPTDNSYFGSYVCKAVNRIGDREMAIQLSMAHPPGQLKQVVLKATATTMSFDFYGPEMTEAFPVTQYAVEYNRNDEVEMKRRNWDIGTPYVLEKLEPLKTYHFRLAAVNQVGDGPWTEEGPITMPDRGVPLEPPITSPKEDDKAVLTPFPDKYQLTWDVPADNGEAITSFQISYREETNASGKVERLGDWEYSSVQHPGARMFIIRDLKPNSLYKIEIRAQNTIGYSEPSSVYIWTAKDTSSVYFQNTERTPVSSLDPSDEPSATMAGMSFAMIMIVAIIILLFVAIVVDVVCHFANRCGVTSYVCVHLCNDKMTANEKTKEAALEDGNGVKPKDSKRATKGNTDEDDVKDATEETPMIDGKNGKESDKKPSTENDTKSAKVNNAVAV